MVQCSNGTTSQQRYDLLTDRPGHDLEIGLQVQARGVLTGRRLGHEACTKTTPRNPIRLAALARSARASTGGDTTL